MLISIPSPDRSWQHSPPRAYFSSAWHFDKIGSIPHLSNTPREDRTRTAVDIRLVPFEQWAQRSLSFVPDNAAFDILVHCNRPSCVHFEHFMPPAQPHQCARFPFHGTNGILAPFCEKVCAGRAAPGRAWLAGAACSKWRDGSILL